MSRSGMVYVGTANFPPLPPDPCDPEARPRYGWMCTKRRRLLGTLCRSRAMSGQQVCRTHGGKAKRAMANAQKRIDENAKNMVGVLVEIATNPEADDKDRIAAAREMLSRSSNVRQPQANSSVSVTVGPSPEYVAAVNEAKQRAALAPEERFTGKVFEITDIVDAEVVEETNGYTLEDLI